jgi:signal transduction histidine kinase
MFAEAPAQERFVDLRDTYLTLRREYAKSTWMLAVARDAFERQSLAGWAIRTGSAGRVVIQGGVIRITNSAFDQLNRDSVIGPPWRPLQPGQWQEDDDGPWPSLAEVVVTEARKLLSTGDRRRQGRLVRGDRVVDLILEVSEPGEPRQGTVLAIVQDIGSLAQVDAELAAMQTRLAEKERATAVGQVALGVAHDLGNLVGALKARLAMMQLSPPTEMRADLQATALIVEAQAALVAKLRACALRPFEKPVQIDLLAEVIRPAILIVESRLHRSELGKSITVRVDRSLLARPRVIGVCDDLVNVLINVLINAADAMPGGGTIHVGAQVRDTTVVLWVDDEGAGIPKEVLGKMFQPLFTTKGARGTGMGLAMARDVLVRAGGGISAINRPEGGARMELRFRRAPEAAVANALAGAAVAEAPAPIVERAAG